MLYVGIYFIVLWLWVINQFFTEFIDLLSSYPSDGDQSDYYPFDYARNDQNDLVTLSFL